MLENPRVQIIRGLPGSGKTTLAKQRFSHLMRIETDMFFSRCGRYVFTKELNRKAVKWFNKTVRECCAAGMDFVVTGVFSAHTERLWTTVKTALDAGYEVYIKTLNADYGNIHNVPHEHLDAMRAAFVSDRQLRREYAGNNHVHFGLMPLRISEKKQ